MSIRNRDSEFGMKLLDSSSRKSVDRIASLILLRDGANSSTLFRRMRNGLLTPSITQKRGRTKAPKS